MNRATKRPGVPETPPISLRGGNALDDYSTPPPFDSELDRMSPEYLEKYSFGVAHLDPASWRYYLPALIGYAFSNLSNPKSMAVEAFLASLRPPDRDPPRFGSLSKPERDDIVVILEKLAFDEASAWKDQAILALEEYWAPGALYGRGDEPE